MSTIPRIAACLVLVVLVAAVLAVVDQKIDLMDDGTNSPALVFDHSCYVYPGRDDDTAAINSAIHRAAAGGCPEKTVHLVPGVYRMNGPIDNAVGVTVKGNDSYLISKGHPKPISMRSSGLTN